MLSVCGVFQVLGALSFISPYRRLQSPFDVDHLVSL